MYYAKVEQSMRIIIKKPNDVYCTFFKKSLLKMRFKLMPLINTSSYALCLLKLNNAFAIATRFLFAGIKLLFFAKSPLSQETSGHQKDI